MRRSVLFVLLSCVLLSACQLGAYGTDDATLADTAWTPSSTPSSSQDTGDPGAGEDYGFCGDGTCDLLESALSCPSDCGVVCGDGVCEVGESSSTCPSDCGSVCGDGVCSTGEDPAVCPADCGSGASGGGAGAAPPPPPPPPTLTWNETVVTRGYRGILGREPDASGMTYYVGLLDGGWPIGDFAVALWHSPEFSTHRGGLSAAELSEDLYQGILSRAPDPGGHQHTIDEINAGRGAQRAASMLDSPEAHATYP